MKIKKQMDKDSIKDTLILTDKQKEEINSLLSKWNIKLSVHLYEPTPKISYKDLTIDIYPIEDEWFLLKITDYVSLRGWKIYYYKCDQMGGLLHFIEMKIKDVI